MTRAREAMANGIVFHGILSWRSSELRGICEVGRDAPGDNLLGHEMVKITAAAPPPVRLCPLCLGMAGGRGSWSVALQGAAPIQKRAAAVVRVQRRAGVPRAVGGSCEGVGSAL
jgi:hypothetical protein